MSSEGRVGPLALAFAQLGRGQPSQAAGNYQRLAKLPGSAPHAPRPAWPIPPSMKGHRATP